MENVTDREIQEYVDDFWDTFNAEEKAALKKDGIEPRKPAEIIYVDFKARKVIR